MLGGHHGLEGTWVPGGAAAAREVKGWLGDGPQMTARDWLLGRPASATREAILCFSGPGKALRGLEA